MKVENYVVSLELSKKIKEAGYPQKKGLFYWCKQNPYYPDEKPIWLLYPYPISYRKKKPLRGSDYDTSNNPLYHEIIAAPISDEILEKLPKKIFIEEQYYLEIHWTNQETNFRCFYKSKYGNYADVKGHTFLCNGGRENSNALASLWLKLKEGGVYEDNNS